MFASMYDVRLPGGRRLDVLRGGAAAGPALVMHHGTPSDASVWLEWDAAAREHGLQLASISRPGYARSDRLPGRVVADVTADVAHVLDGLDAPWFVTAGWSGGGPHALACAALLSDRCRAAATLAGVAPYGVPDLDFLAGMGPENIAEFGAALAGEAPLRAWLEENGAALRSVSASELVAAFGGLIPQVDKDTLVRGFADRLAAEMRRALEPGFDGWIDDDLAFTRPWGFDPAGIMRPITIWQGDLDLMVPFAHGRWLNAAIPGAILEVAGGHGHLSLIAGNAPAIVAGLVARAVD